MPTPAYFLLGDLRWSDLGGRQPLLIAIAVVFLVLVVARRVPVLGRFISLVMTRDDRVEDFLVNKRGRLFKFFRQLVIQQ